MNDYRHFNQPCKYGYPATWSVSGPAWETFRRQGQQGLDQYPAMQVQRCRWIARGSKKRPGTWLQPCPGVLSQLKSHGRAADITLQWKVGVLSIIQSMEKGNIGYERGPQRTILLKDRIMSRSHYQLPLRKCRTLLILSIRCPSCTLWKNIGNTSKTQSDIPHGMLSTRLLSSLVLQ
jgi:hypothetical protein